MNLENLHATDSLNTGHLISFWGDVGCVHVSISDEAKQVWHLICYLMANTQMHLLKFKLIKMQRKRFYNRLKAHNSILSSPYGRLPFDFFFKKYFYLTVGDKKAYIYANETRQTSTDK